MEVKKVKIHGNWDQEIAHYKDNFGRDYLEKQLSITGNEDVWKKLNHHNIVHAKKNIKRNSRGFIDPETMPVLESIRELCGLDDCQLIILRYETGETNLYHKDYIPRYDHLERPGMKMKENEEFANHQYVRCLLMLEDRKPGQFMQTGDIMRNDWKKGDFFYYDGRNVFHSAGNCGSEPRYVLRITGEPTERFWKFLEKEEYVI